MGVIDNIKIQKWCKSMKSSYFNRSTRKAILLFRRLSRIVPNGPHIKCAFNLFRRLCRMMLSRNNSNHEGGWVDSGRRLWYSYVFREVVWPMGEKNITESVFSCRPRKVSTHIDPNVIISAETQHHIGRVQRCSFLTFWNNYPTSKELPENTDTTRDNTWVLQTL